MQGNAKLIRFEMIQISRVKYYIHLKITMILHLLDLNITMITNDPPFGI